MATIYQVAAEMVIELHRRNALAIVPPQQIAELARVAVAYPYNWRKSFPDIIDTWRKAIWLTSSQSVDRWEATHFDQMRKQRKWLAS